MTLTKTDRANIADYVDKQDARIAELTAERDRLKAALEPFAEFADKCRPGSSHVLTERGVVNNTSLPPKPPTFGDFCRPAALSASPGKEEER
jgi:hypothetical protein